MENTKLENFPLGNMVVGHPVLGGGPVLARACGAWWETKGGFGEEGFPRCSRGYREKAMPPAYLEWVNGTDTEEVGGSLEG
jgi:hypothetical protein